MEDSGSRSGSEEPAGYDPINQLEHDRKANDLRLKGRFERIFEKYSKDFTDVGDEIDMRTGDVVVNNGHLVNMQHEADPGKSASSQFVRLFAEGLEKEDGADESGNSDNDGVSDDGDELQGDYNRIGSTGNHDISESARDGNSRVASEARDVTKEYNRNSIAETSTDSMSGAETPTDLLDQIPALQEPLTALKNNSSQRDGLGPDAIVALGQNIANQIAQFMSRSNGRSIGRKTKAKVWDYPELPRRKRRRTESPVRSSHTRSPEPHIAQSPPGQESLWAPAKSRRPTGPRNMRRVTYDAFDEHARPAMEADDQRSKPRNDEELAAEQIDNELNGTTQRQASQDAEPNPQHEVAYHCGQVQSNERSDRGVETDLIQKL